MAFDLPRETRRHFIEELSENPHPQVMLAKRFLKFHETLQKSQKQCVRFLSELSAGNMRTVYGKNLWSIKRQSSCEVSSRNIMKVMKYAPIPNEDKWKIQVVKELLEVKWNTREFENFDQDNDEIYEMLRALCSS